MSVWLFMFSCQSPSLWAMLNPQLTLTLFKCSMRKKKGSCLSAHLRSVQCFLLLMSISPSSLSQLSNGFKNMAAKVNLTFPSTIVSQYWPGVVSGTSSHPLLYQKSWMLKSFMENDRSNGSMFG